MDPSISGTELASTPCSNGSTKVTCHLSSSPGSSSHPNTTRRSTVAILSGKLATPLRGTRPIQLPTFVQMRFCAPSRFWASVHVRSSSVTCLQISPNLMATSLVRADCDRSSYLQVEDNVTELNLKGRLVGLVSDSQTRNHCPAVRVGEVWRSIRMCVTGRVDRKECFKIGYDSQEGARTIYVGNQLLTHWLRRLQWARNTCSRWWVRRR